MDDPVCQNERKTHLSDLYYYLFNFQYAKEYFWPRKVFVSLLFVFQYFIIVFYCSSEWEEFGKNYSAYQINVNCDFIVLVFFQSWVFFNIK